MKIQIIWKNTSQTISQMGKACNWKMIFMNAQFKMTLCTCNRRSSLLQNLRCLYFIGSGKNIFLLSFVISYQIDKLLSSFCMLKLVAQRLREESLCRWRLSIQRSMQDPTFWKFWQYWFTMKGTQRWRLACLSSSIGLNFWRGVVLYLFVNQDLDNTFVCIWVWFLHNQASRVPAPWFC